MSSSHARFAHAEIHLPVAYRGRFPFRPVIGVPPGFGDRLQEILDLDHELDRAVPTGRDWVDRVYEAFSDDSELPRVLLADLYEGTPAYPRWGAGRARIGPAWDATRRRLAVNHLNVLRVPGLFRKPWRPRLVQDLHGALAAGLDTDGAPGEFRESGYTVRGPDGAEVLRPCPPDRIPSEIHALLEWVNSSAEAYRPMIPAAMILQSMVLLRPFAWGNVTVGRVLAEGYLRLNGLPNSWLAPVGPSVFHEPALLYRLCLWSESSGGYAELLDFLTDAILRAYRTATRRWLSEGSGSLELDEVALRLLARARRLPDWFSAREAASWVGGRNDQTVLRHLNRLVRLGVLESTGRTRGKRYRLTAFTAGATSPETAADRDGPGTPTRHRSPRSAVGIPSERR